MLSRRKVCAAKVEATPGTAVSLANADGAFNCYGLSILPGIPKAVREGQSAFSKLAGVAGARMGTARFRTDFIGGASAPFWMSTLLPACGWVLSSLVASPVTAQPGSGGVKTLTIGAYIDGKVRQIYGAVGMWSIPFKAGMATYIDWTFIGCWNSTADGSPLTPTYPLAVSPLRYASSGLTLGGSAVAGIGDFTLNSGNQLSMLEDGNTATGYRHGLIVDRSVGGNFTPEGVLVASDDREAKWLASTQQALAIAMGGAGNGVSIGAPKLDFLNLQDGDRDGVLIDQIDFACVRSAVGGDDELTFTSQ